MMRKLAMNKLNKFINNISALAVNASYFIFICRKEGWGRANVTRNSFSSYLITNIVIWCWGLVKVRSLRDI